MYEQQKREKKTVQVHPSLPAGVPYHPRAPEQEGRDQLHTAVMNESTESQNKSSSLLAYLSISFASSATAQPSWCTSSMHSATARSPSPSPSASWGACCCAAVVKRDLNRRSATLLSGALRATTRIMLKGRRKARKENRRREKKRAARQKRQRERGLVGGSGRRKNKRRGGGGSFRFSICAVASTLENGIKIKRTKQRRMYVQKGLSISSMPILILHT